MDLLSDFDNMNVILGDEISNPSERELAITINMAQSVITTLRAFPLIVEVHHKTTRLGILLPKTKLIDMID